MPKENTEMKTIAETKLPSYVRFSLIPLLGLALAGGAVAARGQSALDGFDANANGRVNVVVVQPDGKILIGGTFTTLSPNGGVAVTRNRIARLNPDGTLDTDFDPNATGSEVDSIAVQADGKILAGFAFTGFTIGFRGSHIPSHIVIFHRYCPTGFRLFRSIQLPT